MAPRARRNLPFTYRPVSGTPWSREARRSSKALRSFRPPGFRNESTRLPGFGKAERRVVIGAVRENAMSPMSAAALASVLSFVVFAIMTVLYVAPWLATPQPSDALIPLLWVHAFRHVALQIYSAQQFGFAVSDGARDEIAGAGVTCRVLTGG